MSAIYIIVCILFMLGCGALVTTILLQKKRSAGLGSMAGMGGNSQTYWDKNKGRSFEGSLEKYSKIGGAVFFVVSIILCVIR